MNLEKLFVVDQFNIKGKRLPMDVVNIIKDFAFDDIVRAFIKNKKKELVRVFRTALESRMHPGYFCEEDSPQWMFLADDDLMKCPIQATNCRFCGGYINTSGSSPSPKILCTCNREYEQYPVEDYYELDAHYALDMDDSDRWLDYV